MSHPNPESQPHRHWHQSDSRDCIDLVIDQPGDNTVRPLTGKQLEAALKERERIEEWLRITGQSWDALGKEVDLEIDGPGDTTVRPATGKMRELLLKERERIAAWEEWERLRKENPDNPPPMPEV